MTDGNRAEHEVIQRLIKRFNLRPDDIERSSEKTFDIRIISSGMTFEVKYDLMAPETGNIAIEYESRGKPTGLSATAADFWVYKFGNVYWAVSTSGLKQRLFKEKKYFKEVCGGDAGSGTKMYLVKVEDFKKWGKQI